MRRQSFPVKETDTAQFADVVADGTGWDGLVSAAASFDSVKLVTIDNQLLKYKPTVFTQIFSSFFIVVGLVLIYIAVTDRALLVVCGITGTLFIFAGAVSLYYDFSPIVFNLRKSVLQKGRRDIEFADVYALQLIRMHVSSEDGDYENYQLNIVFESGSRTHIANYYNEDKARRDAETISSFVNAKLWIAL